MARLNNSLAPAGNGGAIGERQKFSVAIQGEALQKMILKATGDTQSAARLTGDLISLVSGSEELQKCNPASIVAAALQGVGLGLSLALQQYYVVPYAGTARFQTGYKGLLAMALNSDEVLDIDVRPVHEGECIGRDRRTGRTAIDFGVYDSDAEAEQHPIVGYYAYADMGKRFRSEYMSLGAILDHAEQYSKTFDRAKYRQLISGDLSPDEAERLKKKSPWYGSTDAMMKKTVLRRLLNSGFVPLKLLNVINPILAQEDEDEKDAEALASFDVLNVDPGTGDVREQSVQVNPEAEEAPEATPAETAEENPAKKGRRVVKKEAPAPAVQDVTFEPVKEPVTIRPDDEEEVLGSFFS